MHPPSAAPASALAFLRQPRAVWATAFACVVGFMSIGLVDPILTSIAAGLHANAGQVSLLFSSYFTVTALMMLITGFVSSRIGGRATLLAGAALIAVFAALSGSANSVTALALFRGGWGLGNALFVATALSVIVGAANGGASAAVLIYEATLGLGFSIGPVVGAALGAVSWRLPFFGTATLMVIGFIAIATMLPTLPRPNTKIGIADPLRALGHGGLAATAGGAFFYNYAFFTVLAFVPFVLNMSAYEVGAIFFGWGLLLAIFSVAVAPRLQARFSALVIVAVSLTLLAVALIAMASGVRSIIVPAVVLSGAMMGLNNTVFTEIALEVSPAPRAVASAAYNFVRWIGGVIAPFAAPKLAERFGADMTFVIAALSTLAAVGLLVVMRGALGRYGVLRLSQAASPRIGPAPTTPAPILAAIDGSGADDAVLAQASLLARNAGAMVQVLHVRALEILDGEEAATESRASAQAIVREALDALRAGGLQADGEVVTDSGARIAQTILDRADRIDAATIVLGARHRGDFGDVLRGSVADRLAAAAKRPVIFVSADGVARRARTVV